MNDLSRDELGLKIYEIASNHADGYRRAVTNFSADIEKETSEKCACAASNTGYFILKALGYTKDDMDRFRTLNG